MSESARHPLLEKRVRVHDKDTGHVIVRQLRGFRTLASASDPQRFEWVVLRTKDGPGQSELRGDLTITEAPR